MILSHNWLKKYIDLPDEITPEIIRRELTRCTAEVEGFEKQGSELDNIVIGKIVKLSKHPHADKLQVCVVEYDKKKKAQVVCGGTNLEKNMIIAYAKPGAFVRWHGEGELLELKKAVIRGEESEGMICASDEIGLGEIYPHKNGEILNLGAVGKEFKIGQGLKVALGYNDIIYEVENKTLSNRPDLFSHYGFARELSAIFDLPLKSRNIKEFDVSDENIPVAIENYRDTLRYMGVKIDGIKIEESPDWIKSALTSVGLRPINNIVDITNYVMLDLGQPLHAFDFNKLDGGEISVRKASNDEKLDLLDGTKQNLDDSMLIIADKNKPIALAGIMGGANSEVDNKTESIFLECATFEPTIIRKTSTKIGVRTDSSTRFEKALDPHLPEVALKKVVDLILQVIPNAKVSSKLIDLQKELLEPEFIELTREKIDKVLGTSDIDDQFIENTLTKLGFEIKLKTKGVWQAKAPTWRAVKDVIDPEDFIEEILRIYGYDKVQEKEPYSLMSTPYKNKVNKLIRKTKCFCAYELGMNEVYTYAFVSPETLDLIGINYKHHIELENPVAKDTPFLRQSLIPKLLEIVKKNIHEFDNIRIFEIGRVFLQEGGEFNVDQDTQEKLPHQPFYLSGLFTEKDNKEPFYLAKHAVKTILDKRNITFTIKQIEKKDIKPWMHTLRCCEVWSLQEKLGVIYEVNPKIVAKFDCKSRVSVFELNFDVLSELSTDKRTYVPLIKYPSIDLDVSMIVDKKIQWQKVKDIINDTEKELIQSIELFDVFESEELQKQNKKSLAFKIVYQSEEKTLEQAEVQMVHDEIVKRLEKEVKGEVRI